LAIRRHQASLAVFLIALLTQIFAPAGSSLAMGRASSDPLFAVANCQTVRDGASQNQAPGLPPARENCCQLCHFVHSGAAPVAPQIPLLVPNIPPPEHIDWIFIADRVIVRAQRARAQARAPPFSA
jgi:hypothetical protein